MPLSPEERRILREIEQNVDVDLFLDNDGRDIFDSLGDDPDPWVLAGVTMVLLVELAVVVAAAGVVVWAWRKVFR